MTYQFHQVVVFILMTIYVPLIIAYIILVLTKEGWVNHLCYVAITTGLMVGLPALIKNYQQYVMGHFSGLPETITTDQLNADVVFMCVFMLVILIRIYIAITTRKVKIC